MSSSLLCFGLVLGAVAVSGRLGAGEGTGVGALSVLAGAVLSLAWGALGLAGRPFRNAAVATLVPLALILLTDAVRKWLSPSDDLRPASGPILETALLVLTVGLLMYLLHGDRTAAYYRIPGPEGAATDPDPRADSSAPAGVATGVAAGRRTRNRRVA